MHPRRMKAPYNRRTLNAAELRSLNSTPSVEPITPACAFHVPGTIGAQIRVARGFSVTFVFSGLSVSFEAGKGVNLYRVQDWQPSDKIAIVVDKDWGTPNHCLMAIREGSLDDNLRGFVVGGFDLDHTGAVLAGSFWDANLDGACALPAVDPVAEQIADIFVARARDGFDDTTGPDLVREGISERAAMQHYEAGATLAAARMRDTDVTEGRTSYDRQARVMLGAAAIAGHLDPNTVNTTLHLAGLSTREIGNLFDDIVGEAFRLVREGQAALAGAN